MKISQVEKQYILVCNIKDLDKDLINFNVLNHPNYQSALTNNTSDFVAKEVVNIINKAFEGAPIKKVKVGHNIISNNNIIKDATKERDIMYKQMKANPTSENKTLFKNIKIQTRTLICKQHSKEETNKFRDKANNPNLLWRITKNKIYGEEKPTHDCIFYNCTFHRGSRNTSNAIKKI